MVPKSTTCPCGSQLTYNSCCKVYIEDGTLAPDPVTLMRSRYTAFALNKTSYLKKTWHPDTLPDLSEEEPLDWIHLEIIDSDSTDDEGEVEFIAKFISERGIETVHELSDFVKINGEWLYHSGEFENEDQPPEKISMKAPCPCGSGEKFKHCHFAGRRK